MPFCRPLCLSDSLLLPFDGSIDNFYVSGGAQANYDSTKGGLCSRNDLEDLRPCCGMESYYAAPGVTPVTSPSDGSSESPACSSSTAGGTEGTLGTCEGTDDQGKTCPPDYSDGKPCPPGCTTIPASTESETTNTNTVTTGTCEGTDDKGSPCPATYDASKPCPRGCTSIPSSSETEKTEVIKFSWTTANDNEYMCPPVDGEADSSALVCAQGQYPEGTNFGGGASAVLTCPDGEVMACFVFASYGQVSFRTPQGAPLSPSLPCAAGLISGCSSPLFNSGRLEGAATGTPSWRTLGECGSPFLPAWPKTASGSRAVP